MTRKDNLPKNIFLIGKQYVVIKKYKKKEYIFKFQNLEDAKIKLIEIEKIIQDIKNNSKKELINRKITRNDNGIAIIPLKDKTGTIIDYVKVSDIDWHRCMEFPWHKSRRICI